MVPTPRAKYDPEGMAGIINIVMKQNADLGLSGGVMASAGTGSRYNASGNLGYQRGRSPCSAATASTWTAARPTATTCWKAWSAPTPSPFSGRRSGHRQHRGERAQHQRRPAPGQAEHAVRQLPVQRPRHRAGHQQRLLPAGRRAGRVRPLARHHGEPGERQQPGRLAGVPPHGGARARRAVRRAALQPGGLLDPQPVHRGLADGGRGGAGATSRSWRAPAWPR